MPVNDESDQNLREEYEEAQRIAEEAIKKAKGSNTTEDYKAALKACDNANQLASQNYQRTCEANNLASNAAYQRARDLDNSQKNQLAQLQEQYEKGEISKEDYKDITTKFRAARDQAYADAKSIRELNEQANQDAFAQYNKIFAKNDDNLQSIMPAPAKATPTIKATVTNDTNNTKLFQDMFAKQFDSKSDFYKKNQPFTDKDNTLHVSFETPEDRDAYAKNLADNKVPFVMINSDTKQISAYSNGDGKLYQGDAAKKQLEEDMKKRATHAPQTQAPAPGANPPPCRT